MCLTNDEKCGKTHPNCAPEPVTMCTARGPAAYIIRPTQFSGKFWARLGSFYVYEIIDLLRKRQKILQVSTTS